MLPYAPDLVVDRRLVHLAAKVLPAVLGCLAPRYDVLALVKPQFEVGRELVGKGGVVRDAEDRRDALIDVGEAALGLGAAVLGYHSSGLPGPKGNRETFIQLAEPARTGGAKSVEDLRADGARGGAMSARVAPGRDDRAHPPPPGGHRSAALRELTRARPRGRA